MHEDRVPSLLLLGTFTIILDGQTVESGLWTKTQALLVYLVLEPGIPHRRDTLAGLLWPNKSNEIALTSLRQAISQLRKTFPSFDQYLQITPRTIQFRNESQFRSDAAQFLHLVELCEEHIHAARVVCAQCIERLEQAIHLYQGPLLAGFFLKDAPEYEDWLALERQSCEKIAVAALTDMAEYY
ncbi:MAG: BTAD domain-containing putative transcriptional regulator, partial [Anaerolineaceae bacterium]|nr:BTAD domain-containing putative transcriptional regulator [Anaerolineaceae bacterium]